jgi:hypothetical protein
VGVNRRPEAEGSIHPQLASLKTSPPESDHWLHEIEYGGYRTLARISPNGTRLITRNGSQAGVIAPVPLFRHPSASSSGSSAKAA